MPPPAADVNLVYALALLVIVWMHIAGIRKKGSPWVLPPPGAPYMVHVPAAPIVEAIANRSRLSLRLFGNIFSGIDHGLADHIVPAYMLCGYRRSLWQPFDAAIGLIQAFIFALLTILYFASVQACRRGRA